jgi:16S rRNA (guanine(966)-N(2))-methyltransferase RsmD
MRIITGSLKGRRLKSLGNLKIRPPLDQLKQSVFNMLAGEIEGKKVLDLYAGTGSFGLEALSRGAEETTLVDSSFKACRLLKENLKMLQQEEKATVLCRKVNDTLNDFSKQNQKFNIVFVDPPFAANLCQKTLEKLVEGDLLNQQALVIVHHHRKENVESNWEELKLVRRRKFGDNLVSIFLFTKQEQT